MTQQLEALRTLADSFGYELTPKAQREQEKFIPGKWYIGKRLKIPAMQRFLEYKNYDDKVWAMFETHHCSANSDMAKEFYPATPEQVKAHLSKLAVERGFKESGSVMCLEFKRTYFLTSDPDYYQAETDSLWCETDQTNERCCIYKAGQWAEIVETKPKSVWELLDTARDKQIVYADSLADKHLTQDTAFSLLRLAVEKWNASVEWQVNGIYYYPTYDLDEKAWTVECQDYRRIENVFRFPNIKSANEFLALEDAQELLKLVLNVK